MIAELFLIMDLLGDTVDTPISPSAKPQAVRQTKGSTANLAAGLFGIGPITEIKQSFKLTLTPEQARDLYLEGATGRPEKIGTGGRF